jgi:hypothetical protein
MHTTSIQKSRKLKSLKIRMYSMGKRIQNQEQKRNDLLQIKDQTLEDASVR